MATPPRNFDDLPPPQLVRTVNLIPHPRHDLRGPDDLDGIAGAILRRTREGIGDIFAHEDYAGYEGHPTEAWARAIAEHQTGAPFIRPADVYGEPRKVTEEIVARGRYPLVGQSREAATTALCFGGWDGGRDGEIGAGKDARAYCASLGRGFTDVPHELGDWSDTLWSDVAVGACLFWYAESSGVGQVAVVVRKHPTDRKWQIWDTGVSFHDPSSHLAAAKESRVLWESHWWESIPPSMDGGAAFQGIGLIAGLGAVRPDLRPRGRARLLLRRRSDKELLFRSEWLDMEAEGLPISWLLRGLRGAPFFDQIEATFAIDSPPGLVEQLPKGAPLLDCTVDAKGNACLGWSWQWERGYHERRDAASWEPEAPYRA